MALTSIIIRDGQQPTKEQLQEIYNAAQFEPEQDSECPFSDDKMLAEFAEKANLLRTNKVDKYSI